MRLREIEEGVGRIVKGVNTTVDVGPDEITKQAAKLGFKVTKDGVPPLITEAVRVSGNRSLLDYFRFRPVDMSDDRMVELWNVYAEQVLENPEAEYDDPGTSRAFANWLESDGHASQLVHEDPHGAPSWMLMEPIKEALLPRSSWLAHFCTNADRIRREGFLFGVPDVDRIALTRRHDGFGNSERIRYKEPGYNFAYPADGTVLLTNRWAGYGKQVLLFQSSGLLVYHSGDRERQVVFWGPEANLTNARTIKATRSGFVADTGEKARTIEDVIAQITGRPLKSPVR